MRIGVISIDVNRRRTGKPPRALLQSGLGPLIAALLPNGCEVDIIDETVDPIDWHVDYDLLFISSFHSDFDRARQISYYWRRRGAATVYGGRFASAYPDLCERYFDAIAVGDAEGVVPSIVRDFSARVLQRRYNSPPFDHRLLPAPRFELVTRKRWIPIQFEATRGCPFHCNFCVLTGSGTGFHTRPVQKVVEDILISQSRLADRYPSWQLKLIGFLDNNIGGNLRYLHELCEGLMPLGVHWASCITFNAVANPAVVAALAKSGCTNVYVGLESLNAQTLASMRKYQNRLDQVKKVIHSLVSNGIVLSSGMLVSPATDGIEYMEALPRLLQECGLSVPAFVSFECPFPGTPKFAHLASSDRREFLPNVLLRDFDGHTLVVHPAHHSPERYAKAFQELKESVYRPLRRLRKLAADLPHLIAANAWHTAASDALNMLTLDNSSDNPNRTFLGGMDVEPLPASRVPLTENDFESADVYNAIMEPWRVTDDSGQVLRHWKTIQLAVPTS